MIAAVALLRTHPAPPSPSALQPAPATTSTPPPILDARSARLTAAFLHTTAVPAAYRLDSHPSPHAEFVFERYTDPQPGLAADQYEATGLLLRNADDVALDFVTVSVARIAASTGRAPFGSCDATGSHDGSSCTERKLAGGTLAKVERNAAFAQSVASDETTGARPGIQTRLSAVYPNGTLLTVTLVANAGDGIPLDDEAMLKFATIAAVPANGPA